MITPPFGVNLFAAAQVAGCSIDKMMKYLIVFIAVIFACLMIVAYVPPISLTLRDAIMR
jgi:C4-dicarboxylate transporter, DctM subunit